ncbi:MAG: cytochrome C [Sulfurimonas sp.]|nr:cytochrome C [Sulfurimonas sp.]
MKTLIFITLFSTLMFASSAQRTVSYVCYECHGASMNESCMGVSKAPNTLSQADLLTALKAYKDGTKSDYGMGSTMTEIVSGYSNDDLEELSKYIPTLK